MSVSADKLPSSPPAQPLQLCWCGRWGAHDEIDVPRPPLPEGKTAIRVWWCDRHRPGDTPLSTRPVPETAAEVAAPPDLQKLVRAHGGYDRITPEAWAEFDELNRQYQTSRRAGLRPSLPRK